MYSNIPRECLVHLDDAKNRKVENGINNAYAQQNENIESNKNQRPISITKYKPVAKRTQIYAATDTAT